MGQLHSGPCRPWTFLERGCSSACRQAPVLQSEVSWSGSPSIRQTRITELLPHTEAYDSSFVRSLARPGSYEGVPVECRELGIEFGHHTLCLQPAACSSFRVCLPTHPPSFPIPFPFPFVWVSVLSSSSTTTRIPAG